MIRIPVRDPRSAVPVFAVVDDTFPAFLIARRWSLNRAGHPVCNAQHPTRRRWRPGRGSDAKSFRVPMARIALRLEITDGRPIEHLDGDRLNCRAANLRVTHLRPYRKRQHEGGLKPWSPFRNVFFDPSTQKWRAVVRGVHLGLFATDELAAAAAAEARAELARAAEERL